MIYVGGDVGDGEGGDIHGSGSGSEGGIGRDEVLERTGLKGVVGVDGSLGGFGVGSGDGEVTGGNVGFDVFGGGVGEGFGLEVKSLKFNSANINTSTPRPIISKFQSVITIRD